jgi:hypothetical protein
LRRLASAQMPSIAVRIQTCGRIARILFIATAHISVVKSAKNALQNRIPR